MLTGQGREIKDCGAIKQMVLPSGWVEREGDKVMPDGRFVRTFHPPDAPQTHLCIYYRPTPLSIESGRNFLEILVAPFHDLTSDEILQLANVLEGMANPQSFDIQNSGTGYLSGKRVVRLVGRWKQQGTLSLCVFTNADDNGCVIQQVYYSAPDEIFDQHLDAALVSMQSISWK